MLVSIVFTCAIIGSRDGQPCPLLELFCSFLDVRISLFKFNDVVLILKK